MAFEAQSIHGWPRGVETLMEWVSEVVVSIARATGSAIGSISAIRRYLFTTRNHRVNKEVVTLNNTHIVKPREAKEDEIPIFNVEVKYKESHKEKPSSQSAQTTACTSIKNVESSRSKQVFPKQDESLEHKQVAQEKNEVLDQVLLETEALLERYASNNKAKGIALRNTLDDLLHGSEATRQNALRNLVNMGEGAEPFLVASLKEAFPQVAEMALEGLRQIQSPRLVACLSEILSLGDSEQRLAALRVAQRLADDEAQPFLEQGLRDSSARVRRRVLSYLSWRDSSWALPQIYGLCNDTDRGVKWAALEALVMVNPSQAYEKLQRLMPSLDQAGRRRAVILLEQRKDWQGRSTDNGQGIRDTTD
jgi:hypothetical protein